MGRWTAAGNEKLTPSSTRTSNVGEEKIERRPAGQHLANSLGRRGVIKIRSLQPSKLVHCRVCRVPNKRGNRG